MEFRILGPLEAWDDGRELSLGGPKPRALLAVLLLHANEIVPADRLIDEIWGEESPEDAAAALRVNVSNTPTAFSATAPVRYLSSSPLGGVARNLSAQPLNLCSVASGVVKPFTPLPSMNSTP